MFDSLADLHSVDIAASGLDTFWRGSGYVRRQVEGWSGRYRAAITDDVPDGEDVMAWLDAHQPEDVAARMIHGDWRFDNLVVDPDDLSRVRAVLDWEMATVGDPLMDLGASLAYWVQADDDPVFQMFRRQPSNLPGMPTRDGGRRALPGPDRPDAAGRGVAVLRGVRAVPARGHRPADLVPVPRRRDDQPGVRAVRGGGELPDRPQPRASSPSPAERAGYCGGPQ